MLYKGIFHLSVNGFWTIPTEYHKCSDDVLLTLLGRDIIPLYFNALGIEQYTIIRVEKEVMVRNISKKAAVVDFNIRCRLTVSGLTSQDKAEATHLLIEASPVCQKTLELSDCHFEQTRVLLKHLIQENTP